MTNPHATMRIGVPDAARIAQLRLIKPANANIHGKVAVIAMATCDVLRTQAFAAKHEIARVHESYRTLTTPIRPAAIHPVRER